MRQIKFRAWDNVNEKMIYAYHYIDFDQRCMGFVSGVHHHYIELMQYTGLKDKKRTKEYPEGQEIYEGDIIKARYAELQTVFKNEIITIDPREPVRGYWEESEVIGNTMENPELLKEV